MTDPLVQQLTRELGRRAADMGGDTTLAPRVLEQAHAVRRRRALVGSLAAAVAVAAVIVVATGPGLRGANGPKPPPATRTASLDHTTVPSSGAIQIGYAVNGLLRSDGTRARTLVVLPAAGASGGSSVQLPAHWVVQRLGRSGSGLVVFGIVVTQADASSESGEPLAAYIGPTGRVTRLQELDPGAFPVNDDGSLWAAAARLAPVDTVQDSRLGLDFVRPDQDTVVDKDAALPVDHVVGAVGPRSILVEDAQHTRRVWTFGAADQPGPALPGTTALWTVEDTDLRGDVLMRAPGAVHLLHADGAAGWEWRGPSARLGFAASLSPDGTKVALGANPGLVVLAAKDGSVITDGSGTDLGSHVGAVAWEGHDNVLVVQADDSAPATVVRCSVSSGRCVPVAVPAGALVLADS